MTLRIKSKRDILAWNSDPADVILDDVCDPREEEGLRDEEGEESGSERGVNDGY